MVAGRVVWAVGLLCWADGLSRHSAATENDWPPRLVANYSADIILGALFPIHEQSNNYSGCGRIQNEDGIQPLEALLYTIDKINRENILPGFKLGVIALDSCDNVVHALEQSLDFIKGFIAKLNVHHEQQFKCRDGLLPKYRGGEYDRIVGVIGAQSSAVTIQVANLLRLFKVPQISYLSTSTTLSNKEAFDYFFRTVPSDINQANCILEILAAFNWTYVSLVYSNTEYASNGFEELQRLAPKYNVCFALPQRIHAEQFRSEDYDTVVRNLMIKTNARVVVVFTDKGTARNLMASAKRLRVIGHFVWIGSDGWSGRASVTLGREEVIEGAITVQPMWGNISGFDHYFKGRKPGVNPHDPWFSEFWEEYFKCRLEGVPKTPFNSFYPLCSGDERISEENGYRQQWYLHFVRDAAYAFAYALRSMHLDKCYGKAGLCRSMEDHIDGEELKIYLQNVTFFDERGKSFRFLPGGDSPPRYSILNYQRLPSGKYNWEVVGSYIHDQDDIPRLEITNAVKFTENVPEFPASFCSEPCRIGQAKVQQEGDTCCWLCSNCSQYQYLRNEFECQDCRLGTIPSRTKNMCVEIPEEYLDYGNPWAVATMAVAGLGIVLTLAVGLVFWTYSDTPIIKAAGRELSLLLLLGTFLSFATTFVIVAKPTAVTCGLSRFFIGLCYTLCYAAIVTKTNRISRIFNPQHSTPHKARYISPRSQLVITGILTSIELIINTTWLIYNPPEAVNIYPTREDNLLICAGSNNASYLVGLIFPLVLVGFCTVYAFKTRKCPDGFNEARFVAFTNYTTCVVWLAFVPLFFASASNHQRIVTLSFALSLSGMVLLGCLFVPKLYIVLLKPEKNTKEGVMSQHRHTYMPSSSLQQQSGSPTTLLNGTFTPAPASKLSRHMSSRTPGSKKLPGTPCIKKTATSLSFQVVDGKENISATPFRKTNSKKETKAEKEEINAKESIQQSHTL